MKSQKDILILKGDRPNTSQTGSYFSWQSLKRASHDNYFLEQYGDIVFLITDSEIVCQSAVTGRDLASYDLVYLRGITHEEIRNAIAMYLVYKQKQFVNDELRARQYTSKLLQYMAFAVANLPIPPTVFGAFQYLDMIMGLLNTDYPVVAKSTVGSNGNDNFLIHSKQEFDAVPKDLHFVVQPFIPNTFDYRVIVADSEVLIAYKRIRQSGAEYRNNISQGARRELIELLDPDLETMAIAAARSVGRNLSGVDILEEDVTAKRLVLEVNFNYGTPRFGPPIMNDYFVRLARYLHGRADT